MGQCCLNVASSPELPQPKSPRILNHHSICTNFHVVKHNLDLKIKEIEPVEFSHNLGMANHYPQHPKKIIFSAKTTNKHNSKTKRQIFEITQNTNRDHFQAKVYRPIKNWKFQDTKNNHNTYSNGIVVSQCRYRLSLFMTENEKFLIDIDTVSMVYRLYDCEKCEWIVGDESKCDEIVFKNGPGTNGSQNLLINDNLWIVCGCSTICFYNLIDIKKPKFIKQFDFSDWICYVYDRINNPYDKKPGAYYFFGLILLECKLCNNDDDHDVDHVNRWFVKLLLIGGMSEQRFENSMLIVTFDVVYCDCDHNDDDINCSEIRIDDIKISPVEHKKSLEYANDDIEPIYNLYNFGWYYIKDNNTILLIGGVNRHEPTHSIYFYDFKENVIYKQLKYKNEVNFGDIKERDCQYIVKWMRNRYQCYILFDNQCYVINLKWKILWSIQRVIWIGYYKNQQNDSCFLAKMPKDVINLIILQFL